MATEDVTPIVDNTEPPETPVGSEFTSVERYDPAVKGRAFDLFLTTDLDFNDIAVDLGVPAKIVASWARKGKWDDEKKEIERAVFQRAADKYRAFLTEHRLPTIERHLRIASMGEEKVEEVMAKLDTDDAKIVSKLKGMAEALTGFTSVSARAVAITDTPFINGGDGEGGSMMGGKRPLILLNVSPQSNRLEPEVSVKAVDVEFKETK